MEALTLCTPHRYPQLHQYPHQHHTGMLLQHSAAPPGMGHQQQQAAHAPSMYEVFTVGRNVPLPMGRAGPGVPEAAHAGALHTAANGGKKLQLRNELSQIISPPLTA